MPYFPAFLDLRERRCVVIGAGAVGRRKIMRLIHCQANPILVVDPDPGPKLTDDPQLQAAVTLHRRAFDPRDLKGAFLVVASTSNREVNARIGRLCREKDILCNCVDQPDLCSMILPSLVTRGDLEIAVTTGGASPALAGRIRKHLEQEFGPEYAVCLDLLKMLRPRIIARGVQQTENAALFLSLTEEDVLQAISRGHGPELLTTLQARLPADLHSTAKEVLHELGFSL